MGHWRISIGLYVWFFLLNPFFSAIWQLYENSALIYVTKSWNNSTDVGVDVSTDSVWNIPLLTIDHTSAQPFIACYFLLIGCATAHSCSCLHNTSTHQCHRHFNQELDGWGLLQVRVDFTVGHAKLNSSTADENVTINIYTSINLLIIYWCTWFSWYEDDEDKISVQYLLMCFHVSLKVSRSGWLKITKRTFHFIFTSFHVLSCTVWI